MPRQRIRADVLSRDFLETRSKILELAAALDRLDRAAADSKAPPDPRMDQVRAGLEAVLASSPGRAEAVQQIFSLKYEPEWMTRFELKARVNAK